MATSTLLTIDDFERLPAEMAENHELVNGELVDVSGNTPEHNWLRDYFIELLRPFVRKQRLGRVCSEQEYDFLGNAHGPDVTFFGVEKLALLDIHKRVQRFVPDLAIEIASQSDTVGELWRKKDRYLAAGTKEVWLLMPETREVFVYPQGRILRGSDELSTHLIPGFSITVDRLFDEAEA
jgi:Uma2 family endonuclease